MHWYNETVKCHRKDSLFVNADSFLEKGVSFIFIFFEAGVAAKYVPDSLA